jgi:hypothetical protein
MLRVFKIGFLFLPPRMAPATAKTLGHLGKRAVTGSLGKVAFTALPQGLPQRQCGKGFLT